MKGCECSMRCVKCGNEIPNDSQYCPNCGEKISGNNLNKGKSELNDISVYIRKKVSELKQSLLQINMKKKLFLSIGSLIIIFVIIGIVSNNEHLRNENEILKDLQSRDEFFPYCEMDIQQINILQRQTDQNGKSDLILVSVDGENSEFGMNYTVQYELYYYKYNEGWKLDNIIPENYNEWIITEPLKEQVIEDISNELKFLNLDEITISDPRIFFTNEFSDTAINMKMEFSVNETGETYDLEANGIFTYSLTDTGWKFDESQSGVDYGNTRLIAHNYVEEDIARQYLIEQTGDEYSNIELVGENHDLGDNYVTYLYSCEKEHQFATVKQQYNITYFFNDNAEWEVYNFGFNEDMLEEEWHINTDAETKFVFLDKDKEDQIILYHIVYPCNGQNGYASISAHNLTVDPDGSYIKESLCKVTRANGEIEIIDAPMPIYRTIAFVTKKIDISISYDEVKW